VLAILAHEELLGFYLSFTYFLVRRTKWKYSVLIVKLHLRNCFVSANVEKRLFKEEKLEVLVDLRRESYKTRADAESSTRASRRTNARSIDVEDGEGGKRNKRDHANLRHAKSLAREHVRGDGNCKTLESILYNATNKVAHIKRRSGGFRFRHFISSQREIIGRNT